MNRRGAEDAENNKNLCVLCGEKDSYLRDVSAIAGGQLLVHPLDAVHDLARVLRCPATLNHKHSGVGGSQEPPVKVEIVEYNDRNFSLQAIAQGVTRAKTSEGGCDLVHFRLGSGLEAINIPVNGTLKEPTGGISATPPETQPETQPEMHKITPPPSVGDYRDLARTLSGVPEGERDNALFGMAAKLRSAGKLDGVRPASGLFEDGAMLKIYTRFANGGGYPERSGAS